METNITAQILRPRRKSWVPSRRDHKCHKSRHKSAESLLEKGNPSRTKSHLSGAQSALSVDSGLSQTEVFSPFEINVATAYRHLKTENVRLRNDLENLLQEKESANAQFSEVRKQNDNLKEDVSLMKNLVYKLNVELERYQNGGRTAEGGEKKTSKLPKNYEKNFLQPVLPLLKAYSEAVQEKEEIIKDMELECKKFNLSFNDLLEENEKLYVELEKKFASSDNGISNEVKLLKKNLEMVKQENNLLFQQIKMEKAKLAKLHSVFKIKVDEVSKEKKEVNQSLEECRNDLYVLKGKYAILKQEFERVKAEHEARVPLAVHEASVNECRKLFQHLKNEYDKERQSLTMKIREQEGTLARQREQEEQWAEEKNFLEKSNFKLTFEIETLKRKVSELENQSGKGEKPFEDEQGRREVVESRKQLRESNKKVEELSTKLATMKKQLRKAMLFAEDVVRGQEGLLLQLHAKQKENNYMSTQFGSLKNQLKNVEKGAQEGLNSIEEKIRSLEAENYALAVHNRKIEKLLVEKEEIIKKLEPTKDS